MTRQSRRRNIHADRRSFEVSSAGAHRQAAGVEEAVDVVDGEVRRQRPESVQGMHLQREFPRQTKARRHPRGSGLTNSRSEPRLFVSWRAAEVPRRGGRFHERPPGPMPAAAGSADRIARIHLLRSDSRPQARKAVDRTAAALS